MSLTRTAAAFVSVLMVGLLAGAAWADDYLPPDWRGEEGTTSQKWEFLSDLMTDIPPEQWGDWLPSTMITELVPDEDHQEWIPLDGGDWFGTNREGIWALSGHMDVMVDNFPDLNDWKIMWIQLTWHESVENAEPALLNFDPAYDTKEIVFETTEPLCGGWMVTIWEVVIEDNPPDESFRIQGDILVDQLVIDTWCMPEPATLALLGFGGLGVLLRRRRK